MSEIKFNNKENSKYTVKDENGNDKSIYHSRAVTANVVYLAFQENKEHTEEVQEGQLPIKIFVLCGERSQNAFDYQGKLNVPCGHLDWNENIFECGIREVYEETGYLIDQPLNIIGANTEPNTNRQNVEFTLIGHIFIEGEELPKIESTREMNNVQWLKVTDDLLQDSDAWAFKHNELIITCVNEYMHNLNS